MATEINPIEKVTRHRFIHWVRRWTTGQFVVFSLVAVTVGSLERTAARHRLDIRDTHGQVVDSLVAQLDTANMMTANPLMVFVDSLAFNTWQSARPVLKADSARAAEAVSMDTAIVSAELAIVIGCAFLWLVAAWAWFGRARND